MEMSFKCWLEDYQRVFPFMQEEDPPDIKKISRYKTKEDYIRAVQRGGRQTEKSAKQWIAQPASHWLIGEEELVELIPNAITIPTPVGEKSLTIVHLMEKEPQSPLGKKRYRILAYLGEMSKSDIFDQWTKPVGGISGYGGYITHVWVEDVFRGKQPNLYKFLMEIARERGIVGLAPLARPLMSKDILAAQAKYDWKRTKGE